MTIRRILVGWDGSESADAALRLALDYAQELGGEVVALAVFDKPDSCSGNGKQRSDPERRDVREKLASCFDRGPARFHAIVETTSPGRALARFASENGFDLIAVGRRSAGRDEDATVLELAAHATVPLLVVGSDWPGDD